MRHRPFNGRMEKCFEELQFKLETMPYSDISVPLCQYVQKYILHLKNSEIACESGRSGQVVRQRQRASSLYSNTQIQFAQIHKYIFKYAPDTV